ncbi:MAG TPA: type II secretion system F family protein [Roseomonas sp.]|jgi:tight adherence protein B
MNPPLILLMLAAGMALVLLSILRGRASRRVERRLRGLIGGEEIEAVADPRSLRLAPSLALLFHRAGLDPRRLVIALVIMLAVCLALGVAALGPWRAAVLALLVCGGTAFFVHHQVGRRLAALETELPAFLDRMRQHVEIGASVDQAVRRSAQASGPRVQEAMEPLHRRIANGETVPDALNWLAQREGGLALAIFATAVAASLRYGGRLAGTLANISRSLRQRSRLEQELKSSTAETRASAWVLTALPLLVGAGLLILTPGHLDYFLDPQRGARTGMIALGLYLAGVVLVRRLAKPRF